MGKFLLGLVVGIVLVPLAVLGYFMYGSVPVAVNDPPFPQEKLITAVPLEARIKREVVNIPPLQPTEENLIAGAHVYAESCAVCHGVQGKPANTGSHEFPMAPALWEKHHHGNVVGVSDDPPGETYWKVKNGIRLTGMPAYKELLTEQQMWQVSLLLANADKPLSPAVQGILKGQTVTPPNIGPVPVMPPTSPASK